MLKIINGNLLDSDCQYIAHQCNCYSRRGLAGGDWNKYGKLLEDFAERVGERGVSVILYRLNR